MRVEWPHFNLFSLRTFFSFSRLTAGTDVFALTSHGGLPGWKMRARCDGYDRNVVVLTRNRGYRKDIQGTKVPSFIYKKYPRLREAINRRSSVYNEQLELVERLEDAGEITVIRPQKPIVVDRIERDISKLTDLYEEGYACAAAFSFSSDI